MSADASEAAWTDFWSNERAGGGCLPALADIGRVQREAWQAFARALPTRASILDIATGDGAVLAQMRAARQDLRLIGIDSAERLPPPPPGMELRAGIRMEALPFADASFDGITSQFGFEYGDIGTATPEMARVLRHGGMVQLMIHHRSGPILAHNLRRREALQWAVTDSGYFGKARALVAARARLPLPTPPAFLEAPAEARRRFPDQTVGAEILTALAQALERGRRSSPRNALDALAALERKAKNEMVRIDGLARAARGRADIDSIIAELETNGLQAAPAAELCEREDAPPFAWLLRAGKGGR